MLKLKNLNCWLVVSAFLVANTLVAEKAFADASDYDSDGVPNYVDNCLNISNSDQVDLDLNGVGDACEGVGNPDTDLDRSGFVNTLDLALYKQNYLQQPRPPGRSGQGCRFEQPTLISPIDDTPIFEAQTLRWIHNPCALSYFVLVRDLVSNDTGTNNINGSQLTSKCNRETTSGEYICETGSIFNLIVNRSYEWCLTAKTSDSEDGQLFETGPTQCFTFRTN